ncbi:FAD binding domain-containing protein [Myxococcota bacterium]
MVNFIKLNSLEDITDLLWSDGPESLLIAGGTDILVREQPFKEKRILVDISQVKELKKVTEGEGGVLSVGSGLTHQEIVDHPVIRRRARLLQLACGCIGSVQIRNRGTLGGNLGNASPAGDSIPALVCLDARVVVVARSRRKDYDALSFFTGPGQTARQIDELIESVEIPRRKGRSVAFFKKAGQRRGMCCSKASVALLARRHTPGHLSGVRVALGAVAPTVIRAAEAEQVLEGRGLTPAVIRQAAEACSQAVRPIDDIRSTADYRRQVVGALLTEGLFEIYDHMRKLKKRRRRKTKPRRRR